MEPKDSFTIYQLKFGEQTRGLLFERYEYLKKIGQKVAPENYERVYTDNLQPGTTLEEIFVRFNIAHPEDFRGHSLSVSDIIVLHKGGQTTAYYVDLIGFKEVPEFLQT